MSSVFAKKWEGIIGVRGLGKPSTLIYNFSK